MKNYLREYFRLLRFAKSYVWTLVLAGLCMGASTIFEGASLGMIVPLSDRVLTNKKIVVPGDLPHFLSSVIEKFNSIEPLTFLKYMVIFIPILFLLKGLFMFLQNYLMNIVGQGVVREARNEIYAKLQTLSMDFYSRKRTGELMSRVTNDVNTITNAISYALKDLIFESMKVIFFASLAFYLGFKISWKLPLIAFFILPAIMIPVVKLSKRVKKFTTTIQKRMADLNSLMAETIQGVQIVKSFCREDYELKKFENINQQYYKFYLKTQKRMLALSPLTEFVGVLGAAFILWIIGNEVVQGRLSFGIFGVFLAFILSMIKPFKKLSNAHAINQQGLAASSRIYEILDEKPAINERPQALSVANLKEKIIFDNVSFKYDGSDDFALKDINLEIKKGEVIALVGHSGAGKSTLVSLLLRFYDPQQGSVCFDGIDVRGVKLKELRSLISIVSQDTILFNATIRENIAYGRLDATENEIKEAAKKAHAYEFIDKMQNKFDTVVGDRGVRLSGGEKQRIAIARAILKGSPVLILDEATSHLDSVSERLIKEALDTLMEGKTSFVIAHRLSTVQKANKIVVLEDGKIVEMGDHSYLLAENTVYKKLYSLQFNV